MVTIDRTNQELKVNLLSQLFRIFERHNPPWSQLHTFTSRRIPPFSKGRLYPQLAGNFSLLVYLYPLTKADLMSYEICISVKPTVTGDLRVRFSYQFGIAVLSGTVSE